VTINALGRSFNLHLLQNLKYAPVALLEPPVTLYHQSLHFIINSQSRFGARVRNRDGLVEARIRATCAETAIAVGIRYDKPKKQRIVLLGVGRCSDFLYFRTRYVSELRACVALDVGAWLLFVVGWKKTRRSCSRFRRYYKFKHFCCDSNEILSKCMR